MIVSINVWPLEDNYGRVVDYEIHVRRNYRPFNASSTGIKTREDMIERLTKEAEQHGKYADTVEVYAPDFIFGGYEKTYHFDHQKDKEESK